MCRTAARRACWHAPALSRMASLGDSTPLERVARPGLEAAWAPQARRRERKRAPAAPPASLPHFPPPLHPSSSVRLLPRGLHLWLRILRPPHGRRRGRRPARRLSVVRPEGPSVFGVGSQCGRGEKRNGMGWDNERCDGRHWGCVRARRPRPTPPHSSHPLDGPCN